MRSSVESRASPLSCQRPVGRWRGTPWEQVISGRIVTIFGTRPELIKVAPVIAALETRPALETINVLTSQHRSLVAPLIDLFGVRVDHDLDLMRPGQRPVDVTTRAIMGIDAVLAGADADLVLVQGDTASALAGALAAFYARVPVGHVEAGLRTDDPENPFPEEMHRRLITRCARLHFAATAANRRTLLSEGVPNAHVIVTGNPVVDALHETRRRARPSTSLEALLHATREQKRLVLTTHRRESFGELMLANLSVIARFVAAHEDVALFFPVHPNPAVAEPTSAVFGDQARVHLLPPLPYPEFIHLLSCAWLVVSDSGGVQEEVPTLGKPLFVLRESTERPEVIKSGMAELVGGDPDRLEARLEAVHADDSWVRAVESHPNPFGDGNAARAITDAIEAFLGG